MTDKKTYNPTSKEFQDECKKLGLTGRQLIRKYEMKGRYIEKRAYKDGRSEPRMKTPYNLTNTCQMTKEDGTVCGNELAPRKALRYHDKDGNYIGWVCWNCYHKFDPNSGHNIHKSLTNCRTGNLDSNCSTSKGNRSQKLACILYEWEDLNEKYDNHRSPIDCCNPKTGSYHQVQGRNYNRRNGYWPFGNFGAELEKKYETMVCFCFSEDGKIVERIYKFPLEEITRVTGVVIFKNPTDSHSRPKVPTYDIYRIIDEEELKNANDIWKEILKETIK